MPLYGAHEAVLPAEGQGPPEAGLVQQAEGRQAGLRVEQPGQPEPELGQLVGQQAGQPESPEARLWLRAEQRVERQAEGQAALRPGLLMAEQQKVEQQKALPAELSGR